MIIKCHRCDGTGLMHIGPAKRITCEECHGSGRLYELIENCEACEGSGQNGGPGAFLTGFDRLCCAYCVGGKRTVWKPAPKAA